ncbi:MAG: AAA family ATPase [Symploca sp. SIO2C1]|nr:AAA family ATPase [Symploca sp. SIO2C1]
MRIQEISVSGLFGIFDHVIPLNMDERITIIHSPNGFGKTMMLKMLDGLFNTEDSIIFQDIPFNNFRVKFDNDISLEIRKEFVFLEDGSNIFSINCIFCKANSEIIELPFNNLKFLFHVIDLHINSLKITIPQLERIDAKHWRDFLTGKILSLEDFMEDFLDYSLRSPEITNSPKKCIEWLEPLKSIRVRLIESQRLLNFVSNGSYQLSTVSTYSDELAELMQDKFTEYGTLSQSLDRTFPVRVIKQQPSPEITEEELVAQLDELEKTRSRLIEVGLWDKDENTDFQIEFQAIDESTKNILSVYIDVEPKALVLIDEPELSLHVGWQVQFLKDLQEITKLADIDILMATHSPDIIQDRWDLTVELKGLQK